MPVVSHHGLTFQVGNNRPQFWERFARDEWEPGTTALLRALLTPEWQFFDIGSWIGPTALLAASLGAQTYCFEPDPNAHQHLKDNVDLNPHFGPSIQIEHAAVGLENGIMTMWADAMGNSETSVFQQRERQGGSKRIVADTAFEVPVLNFSTFLNLHADPQRPQMFKIDIEGGEFGFVEHIADQMLQSTKSVIHLSTHPFNIVVEDGRDQTEVRREAKRAALSPFLGLNWYRSKNDGHLQHEDAPQRFDECLEIANRPDELVFSNFEISPY